MAETFLPNNLRGLVLSATDVTELTGWPEPMVEDYLTIIENLLLMSAVINEKNDILKTVTRVDVTMSPYDITTDDEEVFFDTTIGDIVANLPAGEEGRNYRLISSGSGDNKVILNPLLLELLFGENAPEYIYDAETLIMTYGDPGGWW